MSEFDTPEWGEDLKEERWTSGLFEQSNAKLKETKNRNRNKYPKGFAKSELSSESKKANSSATLKSPKPELSNKSPNDQIVTQISKKKRKKAKTGGSEVPEHDAGEPPLKTQKTAGQVSARSSVAHQNEKTSKKQKVPAESRSFQNSGQEAEEKGGETNKSSKSEGSSKANRRKRKKNKGLSDTHSDMNEQPAKVKKLTENSTVKDELCASSANESAPQETPKKRKRNRKKKKNASLETTEDQKPSVESSAQESTPKLSSAKRRRERKKRELERKAEENPNFKGSKKRKRRRSSHKSEGEETLKNGNLNVEDTEEKDDDAAGEKNVEGSEKSDKKRKKKRKSLEDTDSKGNQNVGNDSPSKLNESLETSQPSESSTKSKKKKKKVKEDNVSDEPNSSPAQIDVKLVNDKKDVEPLEEPSNLEEENGCNVDNSKGIKKKGPSLREKMEEKLKGARFRFLNEQLYNSKSGDTSKYFLIEKDAFKAYHEGYKQQLNQWPVKPIDLIIKALKKKPANLVIADFGCGDAQLSKALPNKVHSFDHVALNGRVTVCDMAKTPLSKGSVDIVVFCLSLMGSNLSDYIAEANRVMKMGGLMKIAEVESRFEDVSKFLQLMGKFGFLCTCKDLSNDYFYLFDFRKEKNIKEGKILPSLELRACSYKKR